MAKMASFAVPFQGDPEKRDHAAQVLKRKDSFITFDMELERVEDLLQFGSRDLS
jgi:hypothetical protein